MLFLFRKSQRVLLWGLLVVVIITFVGFYGKSGLPSNPKIEIGTYQSKPIYNVDLTRAVRGALVFRRLSKVPNQSAVDPAELEQEGMQLLVRVRQAKAAGMAVSDVEIRAAVDGIFPGNVLGNVQAYKRAIAQFVGIPMPPREFEEHIRNILLVDKVRQYLMTTVLITEDEIKQQYDIDSTLMKLAYVPFFFKDYTSDLAAPTNEVDAFYNTNPEEFRTPDQVDILAAVVEIDVAGTKISDEEVKEYYEENKDYFVITNQTAAVEETSSEMAVDEDSDIAQYKPFATVKEEIQAKIADQRSKEIATDKIDMLEYALLDSSIAAPQERVTVFRQKATELDVTLIEPGLQSLKGAIPGVTNSYEVIRAALSMDPGAQSPVVTIPGKGYLLFIIKEKKASYIPELKECFQAVAKEVNNRRAFESARTMADQISRRIRAATNDFVSTAEKLGLTVRTSIPINRHTGLTDVNCPAQMIANMFAFPTEFPVVLPFMEGFLVVATTEFIPADYDLLALSKDNNPRGSLYAQSANVLMNFLYFQGQQSLRMSQNKLERKEEAQVPQPENYQQPL